MNKKQVIIDFINQVKKEQFIPENCHNLKGLKKKVFYILQKKKTLPN